MKKISYDGFSAAGFTYSSHEDIFYSAKNTWQKNSSYTHMYDILSTMFFMIMDTEPIRFYYNNKLVYNLCCHGGNIQKQFFIKL